jgi:magnesium transporter
MEVYSFDGDVNKIAIEKVDLSSQNFYWFNLNPEELENLNEKLFSYDYDSIFECKSVSQLAKVDFYDEYIFLVLNSLKYENGVVVPDEFNIFFNKKHIITVSKKEVKILEELKSELLSNKNNIFFSRDKSPAKLLYYIIDKLISNDYQIITKLENVADSLEIHIMKKPDKQFLNGLLHLRHQVHTLRRCIAPLRYIGDNLLANENGLLTKEQLKFFIQINSKIEKLIFSLESLVQYIVLVREAFETEMSNKTNELMKLFTIVSMFFSPLTLISGIYGMNFKMPEVNWNYGYLYVIVLMFTVSLALFKYFRMKNWL